MRSKKSIVDNFEVLLEEIPFPRGLEIDLDAIQFVLSSAMSPSGFKLDEIRQILLHFGNQFKYLHLCEGAAEVENGLKEPLIGKILSFLISDFAKSHTPK